MKRILSAILAASVAMGSLALPWVSYAEDRAADLSEDDESVVGEVLDSGVNGEKDGSEAPTSGKCGDNLTWVLNSEGSLTISGTGDMYNYVSAYPDQSKYSPWHQSNKIKYVKIDNGITSIGNYAFYGCDSLVSIIIPESVIKIGEGAFFSCSSITSITIPKSVNIIDYSTFLACSNLTSITVDTNNPNYCSLDGVLFNKDKTKLLYYPANKLQTNYKFPKATTTIGRQAFDNCRYLESIDISNNITSIEEAAFFACQSLSYITIPSNITSIKDRTFMYCDSLKWIEIPNSVIYLGSDIFWGTALTDIYYSGTEDDWLAAVDNRTLFSNTQQLPNMHYNSNRFDSACKALGEKVTFNRHTYQLIHSDYSWKELNDCLYSNNGYIASINTADEDDFIYNYIKQCGYTNVVIGLYKDPAEDEWKWASGEDVTYTNWHIGEPNNESGKEFYAHYYDKFGDGTWNDCPFPVGDEIYICEWENEQLLEQAASNVHFLSSYNPETSKVNFDSNSSVLTLEYTLADTVDKELVSTLVNKYVVAEIDTDSRTVTSLKPVESKIGAISSVNKDNSSVTIDDKEYALSEDNPILTIFAEQQTGKEVLFHTYEGTIVSFSLIEKRVGKLESWDSTKQELTIDGKVYPTNFLADISFLANIDELLGKQVTYTYIDSGIYFPVIFVELCDVPIEPEKIYKVYTDFNNDKYETFNISLETYISQTNSTEYNPALSHMMIAMSNAAYDEKSITETYKNFGFKDIQTDYYYNGDDELASVAYAFGKKTMTNGKSLVMISLRGSKTIGDWINNFTVGIPGSGLPIHFGFSVTEGNVYNNLLNFLGNNISNTVFVITGHSRAAAVANLLEYHLLSLNVAQENLYGYNFACPDVMLGTKYDCNPNGIFDNIFNIGNVSDPVTLVPGFLLDVLDTTQPGKWGKFGQSRWYAED